MSVKIIDAFLPVSEKVRNGAKHTKKWVVIHETANTTKGANAKAHSNYLNSLTKSQDKWLSWHYTVDDKEIYHHIPDNEIAWHATDGTTENGGNMSGIGIEICINSDGNFAKARDNAAWLTAKLLKDNGWGIDRVKQHHDFKSSTYPNGKDCPHLMRKQGLWGDFLSKVTNYLNQMKGSQNANTSAFTRRYRIGDKVYYSSCYKGPNEPEGKALMLNSSYFGGKFKSGTIVEIIKTNCHNPYKLDNGDYVNDGDIRTCNGISMDKPASVAYFPKYKGSSISIEDALKAVGSTQYKFDYRAKIAKANSIANYTGSAAQNEKMLYLLKQGKLIKP